MRLLNVQLLTLRPPLRTLCEIIYDEISIEKPTLEDYFLEAAKK